jgi:hypothetical protein
MRARWQLSQMLAGLVTRGKTEREVKLRGIDLMTSVCITDAETAGFGCESGSGYIEIAFGLFVVIAIIIAIAIVIPILAF